MDPSDIDSPLFPLTPQRLTRTVARESKSFNQRKSSEATLCDLPTTSFFQNKIDELSTSANPPTLKTASDLSHETISLLIKKLSSILYSTPSVDVFLQSESKDSSNNTLTSSPELLPQFYNLWSRPIQTLSSFVKIQHQINFCIAASTRTFEIFVSKRYTSKVPYSVISKFNIGFNNLVLPNIGLRIDELTISILKAQFAVFWWNIRHSLTNSNAPRTIGLVEVQNKILRTSLRSFLHDTRGDWSVHVFFLLLPRIVNHHHICMSLRME